MKKIRIACALFALLLLCGALAGCKKEKTDEELILARMDAFLFSYNTGDLEKLLDSMDSRSRNKIKSYLEIAGLLTGKNVSSIFSAVFAISLPSNDDLLDVEPIELEITDDENAVFYTKMSYTTVFGTSSEFVKFLLVKEEDDWFVENAKAYTPSLSQSQGGSKK